MKKVILFVSLFFNLSAAHLTEGDCIIIVEEMSYHDHEYLYFNRQCVIHDPDCWCHIPLPPSEYEEGNHSFLD